MSIGTKCILIPHAYIIVIHRKKCIRYVSHMVTIDNLNILLYIFKIST